MSPHVFEPRRGDPLPLFEWADRQSNQFLAFHHDNPHVYVELKRLCLQVRRAGVRRFGIRTLWERLRWHAQFETARADDWKLNNNYTRYYARLLMEQEPELDGLFEIRRER